MLFYTHLLIGITLFLLVKDYFAKGNELFFFLLVLLGSILPDIDEGKSKINQWSGILGRIIAFFSTHRGIFHSLLLYLFFFLIISYFYTIYYGQALFLGYLAHLLGDGITKQGVQVFYPFFDFKIRGFVKVGGFWEWLIVAVLIVLIVKELV